MRYFDSHAHYYDERFDSESDVSTDELISSLLESSVSGIINIGTSPETSRLAIEGARRHTNMYTAIGIHPSDSQYLTVSMDDALCDIESLIRNPENKCVALGEIGLDYHYPDTDRDCQIRYFEAQMTLADTLGIPVSIHDREAHGDVMDVIRRYPNVRGVMHSFSGSAEMARQLAKLGWSVSFSGPVTYKNASKVKEAAAIVPDEALLVETDSPYLPPVPYRGKTNYPGYVAYTVRAIAEIKGKSEAEIAELTLNNAKRFFGIK